MRCVLKFLRERKLDKEERLEKEIGHLKELLINE
jgi:hypothetical protein